MLLVLSACSYTQVNCINSDSCQLPSPVANSFTPMLCCVLRCFLETCTSLTSLTSLTCTLNAGGLNEMKYWMKFEKQKKKRTNIVIWSQVLSLVFKVFNWLQQWKNNWPHLWKVTAKCVAKVLIIAIYTATRQRLYNVQRDCLAVLEVYTFKGKVGKGINYRSVNYEKIGLWKVLTVKKLLIARG